MKLKDFDFRIYNEKFIGCSNKSCKCHQTKFIYGNEAKVRLSEFDDDTIINLCTNFEDINGKKIYEGDILKNKELDELYLITRNDVSNVLELSIYRKNIKGILYEGIRNSHISFLKSIPSNKYMEIIGNVYENSELLKGVLNVRS
ncbi:YopX family protein [Campylobacter insulaenigrae]|uniref:YopX family protein n=1 Tax=Campylobacter insulaenigrae TaxID=260714 RepID=UPI002152CA7A|nr:YopX family protein [Campylobacter insulaenigrae]MCR6574311.1 YopX family protein [Campylobacter insulaenigrae]